MEGEEVAGMGGTGEDGCSAGWDVGCGTFNLAVAAEDVGEGAAGPMAGEPFAHTDLTDSGGVGAAATEALTGTGVTSGTAVEGRGRMGREAEGPFNRGRGAEVESDD